jgi:SAM-dependent methyltransferase
VTSEPNERPAEQVRALSFGSVAEMYERYRLGYPDELVDTVVRHARRPVRTALEVGAGTGKATRVFASQGIEITALEPDAEMARVLATTTHGMSVRPMISTLEGLETAAHFDLVYAAAAWHWTDPATRWTRVVDLLEPGGVLALFGRPADLADPSVFAAVDEIEKQVLPNEPAVGHPWSFDEMSSVDGLVDGVQLDLPYLVTTTAEDFVGRLATVSVYLMLDPDARADALSRVRAVLPDQITVDARVHVALARRA